MQPYRNMSYKLEGGRWECDLSLKMFNGKTENEKKKTNLKDVAY